MNRNWEGFATYEAEDREILDHVQYIIEKEIANYALEEVEDCYDIENDLTLRGLRWSRGDSDYWIVISPFCQIKYIDDDTPNDLIVQTHNCLADIMVDAYRWGNRTGKDPKMDVNMGPVI